MTVHEILFELQKLWLANHTDPDGKKTSTLIAHLSASTESSSSEMVGVEVFSGLFPAFITEVLNQYAAGQMSLLHQHDMWCPDEDSLDALKASQMLFFTRHGIPYPEPTIEKSDEEI